MGRQRGLPLEGIGAAGLLSRLILGRLHVQRHVRGRELISKLLVWTVTYIIVYIYSMVWGNKYAKSILWAILVAYIIHATNGCGGVLEVTGVCVPTVPTG